jgi:general secretion pathway protein L
MTETLVIRLRASEEAPASWLIVDGTGARSGSVQSGPVDDALALAQGRRTVVILPAAEATLAAPDLPVRGGARIAQAVPFALEEQLASDLESMHFAVGARNPAGAVAGTPVVMIARPLLERWRSTWEAAGIRPDAAYSESSLLPSSPNACVLLLDEATLHVQRPDSVGYALDAQPLPVALDLVLGETTTTGEHVPFYATPQDYERHKEAIEGLRTRTATLQVKLLPDGTLPLLASQIHVAHPVNVLQGAYAPPSSLGTQFKRWRLPIALAALTLLAFLAAQGMRLWQLHKAEQQLDTQIAQIFKQVLPGQPMVDARSQLEGVLRRSAGGQDALLPAISLLARAMAKAPSARIEGIIYRTGALELRLLAPNVETLDGIKQTLAQNGATVELQSANPRDKAVEGRLHVKLGAA